MGEKHAAQSRHSAASQLEQHDMKACGGGLAGGSRVPAKIFKAGHGRVSKERNLR